ncbi:esterase YqiA [Exilibacterium tricleocarpae]|uniref:Esterase YqiA n=1 Tax=Exilibacterium tricleocarpae TaxID=2591008 RepID=A0A545TFI9_9GAMM|nr:YqiA/YcfP family alpha/beta fold hydrolase [Exilibacterium tricleocarpae]TQV75936.1 esterase YqiA [Exilibacterium tricleocarpae]
MPVLLYIHGFLSAPTSHKAQQVRAWLQRERPDIDFCCPLLTPFPQQVCNELDALVESLLPGPVYLMGSSMGGFWSTYLAEKYDLRAVLINPAVEPQSHMPDYVGIELKNFYTEDTYRLQPHHIDEMRAADIAVPKRLDNYWLMVQTGDETLDYRDAVAKYRGCKQLVEEGGDHSFRDFERWIPAAVEFLEAGKAE